MRTAYWTSDDEAVVTTIENVVYLPEEFTVVVTIDSSLELHVKCTQQQATLIIAEFLTKGYFSFLEFSVREIEIP